MIYFYICVQELLSVLWKILHGVGVLCATAYLEYLPLTGFELPFLQFRVL